MRHTVPTMCNRDCPDACAILADVEDGRVVGLRGDPQHPVTQGFLCHRTQKFLERQYSPQRILRPLLRQGDRQVEIPLDEALDMAAQKLLQVRAESGGAAIFHYRSGGSLGMLKEINDYFFEQFGPVTTKSGDICSGAGDAAQETDFGEEDGHDIKDILHARHIVNWGKNVFVSSVHLIPILKDVRSRGTDITLIDPVRTRSIQAADRYMAIRPGGDAALAMAVAQVLFDTDGMVGASRCDFVDDFRRMCFQQPLETLLQACDLTLDDVRHLARVLSDGPTAILVGWGMQRRLQGSANVRLLDALCTLTGNLGRPGGGVFFSTWRRRPFNLSFKGKVPPPRQFPEPLIGQCVLAAKDPPVRYIWVTAGNPVAMLPDSATVARAFETTEFSVVVDAFETDTTRRATLVLPTTTMLEDDDLIGSYGHHYVGVSRPVVAAPPEVLTDLEIMQQMAVRVGLGDALAGSARDWKRRLLKSPLEAAEAGAVRHTETPPVLFATGTVPTPTGRVQLIHSLPAGDDDEPEYPLWLLSNSTEKSQSSQWVGDPQILTATVHPDTAGGLVAGTRARLVSAIGALEVEIRLDPLQRRDVVIVPKGGHYDKGQAANALIRARLSDDGGGAAYQDARVRIEPLL